MFVPDANGHTFYLKVNKYLIRSLFMFVGSVFFISVFFIYKSAEIGVKIQLAYYLNQENIHLREENKRLSESVKKIDSLEKTGEYLKRLATLINAKVPVVEKTVLTDTESIQKQVEQKTLSTKENADIGRSAAAFPSIVPVVGWVTQRFNDGEDGHDGIDIAAQHGSLIRATAPGIVDSVYVDKYLGLVVSVKHRFGFETLYGHCGQTLVSGGEIVGRGQAIAFVGNTGHSSAPHCHYEVLKNGTLVDPSLYIFPMQ